MGRAGGRQLRRAVETSANTFIKWNHHIGSVVNALAAAGLHIEFLHEYEFTDAPFQGLERGEDGLWRVPAKQFQIPLMFSLRAGKDRHSAGVSGRRSPE